MSRLAAAAKYCALVLIGMACGVAALAQDAPSRASDLYHVLFENERVRVLDAAYPAGAKSATHAHPALVAYAVTDAEVRFHFPGGEAADASLAAGEAIWSEADIHAGENTGSAASSVILFELKDVPVAGTLETPEDNAVRVAPDAYKVLLENDRVRVFETTAEPGEVHRMHTHLPMVIHVVAGSSVEHEMPDGTKATMDVHAGQTMAVPASQHISRNVGDSVLHVVAVELKEVSRTEANLALTRRFMDDVLNGQDLSVLGDILHPDGVYHDSAGNEVREIEANRGMIATYFEAFPDLSVTVEDQVAQGDRVVTRSTVQGTHDGPLMGIPPTNRSVTVHGIVIDRIVDGKVVETWEQFDQMGMMQQLGIIPNPAEE